MMRYDDMVARYDTHNIQNTSMLQVSGDTLSSHSVPTNILGQSVGFNQSTSNRLYIGFFGVLMRALLVITICVYLLGFILSPSVDIDGIREPVAGSLLYQHHIRCSDP
jgi:hypothetical protein